MQLTRMQLTRLIALLAASTLVASCAKQGDPAAASHPAAAPATSSSTATSPIPDVGKLETVTVTAEGSGPTAGVAVQEAMKLAILEVNGVTIDTSSIAVKFGLDVAEGQTVAMLRGSAFAEAVAQRSKGTVTGFKLVSMAEPTAPGGAYRATIEAAIAKFRPPTDSKKIKIVIAPLRVNASSFEFGSQSLPAAKVADDIRQRLIDALTATGRFSVLDRDFDAEANRELDLIATGQTPNAEMAKLNQTLSADLLWVGTINDFAYVRHARKLMTSDRELVSYSGGWSVSQRIVNVATRQILLSSTLQERAPPIEPTTMDRGVDVVEIEAGMESAIVGDTVAAILTRTFPVTVVAKDGSNVVLSQGGQSVKAGARYAVVSMGKELVDPQTHESLGRMESPCCDVVIDKVAATLSYGHLENTKMPLDSVQPDALQIREELVAPQSVPPATASVGQAPGTPLPAAKVAPADVPESPAADANKKW
jgi:curli biogenesis system outer membrane secretion channel CsgG